MFKAVVLVILIFCSLNTHAKCIMTPLLGTSIYILDGIQARHVYDVDALLTVTLTGEELVLSKENTGDLKQPIIKIAGNALLSLCDVEIIDDITLQRCPKKWAVVKKQRFQCVLPKVTHSNKLTIPTIGSVNRNFGMKTHPILKRKIKHNGLDYAGFIGKPIVAAHKGVVVSCKKQGGYGIQLMLKGKKFTTTYSHLSKCETKLNAKVKRGQLIALMGNTGLSTGPHLHFEVFKSNSTEPIDPYPLIGKF